MDCGAFVDRLWELGNEEESKALKAIADFEPRPFLKKLREVGGLIK